MGYVYKECPSCGEDAEHESVSNAVKQMEDELDQDEVYYKCGSCGAYHEGEEILP